MENYPKKIEEEKPVCPDCAGELSTRPMQIGGEKYFNNDPYCLNCEGYLENGQLLKISEIIEKKKNDVGETIKNEKLKESEKLKKLNMERGKYTIGW